MSMSLYLMIMSVSYFSGLLVFSSSRKHLLTMLLSLEYIIISLFLMLFMFLNGMEYDYFFCMIFLTLSVCESALGLCILVMMIRNHGNDYVLTFSSLW